jgi:hypothetical protein
MKATVKCSHCGAEITNLNFSWGKKQVLWMIPFLLLCLLPLWRIYQPKGDFRKDLEVNVLEKRVTDSQFAILGTIQNTGKTQWKNIELDAEFYSDKGQFVDEASGRVSSSIEPGAVEHFKIEIRKPSEVVRSESTRMELKVADAYSSPF